jgi:predicted nucleic acid-binding protein
VALTFLIDTSVIKRLAQSEVRQIVEPLAAAGELARASISDLEVGYSARNAAEWDRLVGALDAFELVDSTAAHQRRALQVQRLLAERSQRGRKIPDLLIAAAAEELGVTVLHYDGDFEMIASVTGQRCQWVVPAGTVE